MIWRAMTVVGLLIVAMNTAGFLWQITHANWISAVIIAACIVWIQAETIRVGSMSS